MERIYLAAINCATPGLQSVCASDDPINALINFIANWITGIIGLVAVTIIVFAGVQLISSSGNPEAVKSAKSRIVNAIIGIATLIAMRAILYFIFPPGTIQ